MINELFLEAKKKYITRLLRIHQQFCLRTNDASERLKMSIFYVLLRSLSKGDIFKKTTWGTPLGTSPDDSPWDLLRDHPEDASGDFWKPHFEDSSGDHPLRTLKKNLGRKMFESKFLEKKFFEKNLKKNWEKILKRILKKSRK